MCRSFLGYFDQERRFVNDKDPCVRLAVPLVDPVMRLAPKRPDGKDAVLMDVVLAGYDGIAATRAIRALPGEAGQVPVIGISGRSEGGSEEAARAAGMNFYFAKPVSPGKLAQALAELPARR